MWPCVVVALAIVVVVVVVILGTWSLLLSQILFLWICIIVVVAIVVVLVVVILGRSCFREFYLCGLASLLLLPLSLWSLL